MSGMNNHTKITATERDQIGLLKARGISISEIGRTLGRSKSSISEEVLRNSFKGEYVPIHAQAAAEERAENSHHRSPLKDPETYAYVLEKLRDGWSPEQIAGRKNKEEGRRVISYETIYRFIYDPKNIDLKLWEYLPWKRKKRYKKQGRKAARERIPNRVSIHVREANAEIEERHEFGHWEGDSVIGRQEKGKIIHTECERKTRFLQAKLIASKEAALTVLAQQEIFSEFPALSTTMDNGLEFSEHEKLHPLGVLTYFADPYCSCQRGTNEHHNGLLRRYLPKGQSFEDLTEEELTEMVEEINDRPRKVLDYDKPAEVMAREMLKYQSVRIGV